MNRLILNHTHPHTLTRNSLIHQVVIHQVKPKINQTNHRKLVCKTNTTKLVKNVITNPSVVVRAGLVEERKVEDR